MRPIPDVGTMDIAFGTGVVGTLLPNMEDIPFDFPNRDKFEKVAATWFYFGLAGESKFHPKEGVDTKKAQRVLQTCLGSFDPRHEHKMTGVAYLMSEWFEDIEAVPNRPTD